MEIRCRETFSEDTAQDNDDLTGYKNELRVTWMTLQLLPSTDTFADAKMEKTKTNEGGLCVKTVKKGREKKLNVTDRLSDK